MKYSPFYLLCFVNLLSAQGIDTLPSYQGFRGAINTPNAEVMKEGEFEFLYTNQTENLHADKSPDFRTNREQQNFFLNMGIIPNLDVNFQYADAFDNNNYHKEYIDNRIINLKYHLPFIPDELFSVAIGMQDIGGINPYIKSKYAVVSKKFKNIRTNVGYAKGEKQGSLDGVFGSVEYAPLSWLQLLGEYDTKEWNTAIKANYPLQLGSQTLNLGLMAKRSLGYNENYFGVYANLPFYDKSLVQNMSLKELPAKVTLSQLNLANSFLKEDKDKLYFEYENNLYVYNDIDALGMVLGVLSTTTEAKEITVAIKKSNIIQYTIQIDSNRYKQFLKDGKYQPSLLNFISNSQTRSQKINNSDLFKPTLSLRPDFVLVDGSEYSDVMDYTYALQAELSMRLAKGTMLSTRYNIPLEQSLNFERDRVFSYRNRHKTTASFDQVILSQYLKVDTPYNWINLLQVGRFDEKLEGISFESGISSKNGTHQLLAKVAKLNDGFDHELDRYSSDKRNEQLLSYRYYLDSLDSNIKLTAGEFLYGDKGERLTFQRFFSDITLQFDIARTTHPEKGDNNIAKLSLSIPLGFNKYIRSDYLNAKIGNLNYEKRKRIVDEGGDNAQNLPHHLKELDNSFTIEKYYMNNNRFQPNYIKEHEQRLRNIFILNK